MNKLLNLKVGVKTDPVEYRYSYEWLFNILQEEDIHDVQLGSFPEIYHLPDSWFLHLRDCAKQYKIDISSVFTSHRELGGFFRLEPEWHDIARRNFERLIKISSLLGAKRVGSNPGSVLRDQMPLKDAGVERYIRNIKELMYFAHICGIEYINAEPMSCLAEPPTLPEEIRYIGAELLAHHKKYPDQTCSFGLCMDIAHGYVDQAGKVVCDHFRLLECSLPYLTELHLKNTDKTYCATFGFSPDERKEGIIHVDRIREVLCGNSDKIPSKNLVGYLEIHGSKLGRDSTDRFLDEQLRESLRYLKQSFSTPSVPVTETLPKKLQRVIQKSTVNSNSAVRIPNKL